MALRSSIIKNWVQLERPADMWQLRTRIVIIAAEIYFGYSKIHIINVNVEQYPFDNLNNIN